MKEKTIHNKKYHLAEGALVEITQYLDSVRSHFADEAEVISDIEMACVEILDDRLHDRTDKTLTETDIQNLIQKLGTVSMISDQTDDLNEVVVDKKLYRDAEKKWLGGVAAGLAAYFDVPVWTMRLAFVLGLFAPVLSVTLYLVLWYILPVTKTKSDQLRMHGASVSLSSLSKNSAEGFVRKRVITLAKVVGITFGFFVLMIFAAITIVTLGYIYHDEKKPTPNSNTVYEYSCASGQEYTILMPEVGGQSILINSQGQLPHNEYTLSYVNDESVIYDFDSHGMENNDKWQFRINRSSLEMEILDRKLGAPTDTCLVVD